VARGGNHIRTPADTVRLPQEVRWESNASLLKATMSIFGAGIRVSKNVQYVEGGPTRLAFAKRGRPRGEYKTRRIIAGEVPSSPVKRRAAVSFEIS